MGRIISTHFFVIMTDIVEKVRELISNILQEKEIELFDITYKRESGGMMLRLLVDKAGGVTLGECASLNEEIGNLLDRDDVVPDKYVLEVASPGLDRQLKSTRDFQRVLGKKVYVHTYKPVREKRDHEGIVNVVSAQSVTIDDTEIRLDNITKAKLKIEI